MNKIEQTINRLLETNPFYAHFFLNCEIQYDTHNVPTAGVMLTDRNIRMVFNTKFIDGLTVPEIGSIIEHEVIHILMEHISVPHKDKTIQPQLSNIAMDCAINQYIKNLPDGGITLDRLSKMLKVDLEPLQTWEYYYHKILQDPDVAKAMKTLDDHSKWAEGNPQDGSGKVIARAAAEAALKASKGIAPEMVLKALDALREGSKTPWQQILANFVARATSSTIRHTRKKRNRRFGIDQPGKLKKRELTLGVCCDSSGSISDESYTSFMVEVQRIAQYCTKVYLIDADAVVQDVTTLKKGAKVKMKRHGCGGTAYQPAISECLKLKTDAIIYFGDFDCADVPQNPHVPFLWVGVGNQPPPGSFGAVLRLE